MNNLRFFLGLLAIFCVLTVLVVRGPFSKAENDANVVADFGEPIPGLDPFEQFQFSRGKDLFTRRFSRADGVGPHFNATSCFSCHEDPVAGGSSQRYRDFFIAGRALPDGSVEKLYEECTIMNFQTHLSELCLPSLVIPHYGPKGTIARPVSDEVEHPPIPPEADVVALRNAPPLFGVGFFRLVSDDEIRLREDPDDTNKDGISGRVNIISTEDDAIGRFGYKCQTASIEAFNRGALHNQMGLTSDSLELVGLPPEDSDRTLVDRLLAIRTAHAQVAAPKDRIFDFDGVRDPEISRSQLQDLIFFQEHLAAPRRGRVTATVLRGEKVFSRIGCADCHVSSLDTPLGLIHPYTDLLLHDMGEERSDGVAMEDATGSEFRTQPLWGFCVHAPFLHDGIADTVEEAIQFHGGEAAKARDAFAALSDVEREELLRFLESL